MEEELDYIAKGEKVWYELCETCYQDIIKSIESDEELKYFINNIC